MLHLSGEHLSSWLLPFSLLLSFIGDSIVHNLEARPIILLIINFESTQIPDIFRNIMDNMILYLSLLPNPGCTGAPEEEFDMFELCFDPAPELE